MLQQTWEQRKLGEIASINPRTELPNSFKYVDLESVIGTNLIGCKKIEKENAPSRAQRLASFGDIFYQTVRPYQRNNYLFEKDDDDVVFSTGYAQLRSELDSYFLFTLIQTDSFVRKVLDNCTGTSYPAINSSELGKILISVPQDKLESHQIGTVFRVLDNVITLHQRKLEHLKLKKKSLLQKLFPKEGEVYPELRFPGFTDPWEQRKFKSLFQKNLERNDGQFPFNKTISISRMIYSESGNGANTESLDNYKVLRVGDIAFEGHENKDFKFGRFVMNDVGNGIMSPRFTVLRPLIDMELNFWKEYINYEPIMQKKLVYSTKKGTMMNELVIEDFLNQYVAVPSIQEQQKIGYLLKCMTDDITIHQRKLEHLQLLKKALLQQLFV